MSDPPPARPRARARGAASGHGRRVEVGVAGTNVRLPLSASRVAGIVRFVLDAEQVAEAHIAVTFVSPRQIARLNASSLGRPATTDVIALQHRTGPGLPVVGDVFIAPAIGRRNARLHGRPQREELARLAIHGVLHALGMEHPAGRGRERSAMWLRQESLLGDCRRAGLY